MSLVITIGRQKGSAGLDVGKRIAEVLGIPCYDKELVELAADKSNLSPEALKNADERATNSFLYSVANGGLSFRGLHTPTPYDMPINDKLFIAQSEIIKEIASKGNCVIVGRCADYVLRDVPDTEVLSVFVYGSLDYRIKRVAKARNLAESKARDMVVKTDKRRRSYYEYYTSNDWGVMNNYDLCLSTEKLGINESADIVIEYVKKKYN
ncbi:MAG: cytidylate kinase-like family protein [bacterium]|nr:cytidylate kinase-like family protein [bacterium]